MTEEIRAMENGAILSVQQLSMNFRQRGGGNPLRRDDNLVRALDEVSFDLRKGETLGLVGESGCGKTTTARCIVRAYTPTGGKIAYGSSGQGLGQHDNVVDIARMSRRELRDYRREVRMIFQNPYGSLNPRFTIFKALAEPFKVHGIVSGDELKDRVEDLLTTVGLRPEHMHRYPHAFSGGERQRIGIARALATEPRIVVADEAVSALDLSVQAQILNLLVDAQRKFDLTYLFVSHDLSVVRHISDRVAVMYVGSIVEMGEQEEIFAAPRHPYTEALLAAVPRHDPLSSRTATRARLSGEVADPAKKPTGCAFHPRCAYAVDICKIETPTLRVIEGGRSVACHRSEELQLVGVEDGPSSTESQRRGSGPRVGRST